MLFLFVIVYTHKTTILSKTNQKQMEAQKSVQQKCHYTKGSISEAMDKYFREVVSVQVKELVEKEKISVYFREVVSVQLKERPHQWVEKIHVITQTPHSSTQRR